MSAGNQFEKRRKAFLERAIAIGWGLNNAPYTVRVGTATDDFMVDRVINVSVEEEWGSIAIYVPDGIYSGQRLLVNYIEIDIDMGETVDVTLTTAPETVTHPLVYQLGAPGDYVTLEWIDSDTGWINWNNQIT